MVNSNAFIKWFNNSYNKELFETNIIPIVCEFNGQILGGNWKIMYQSWAFDMALTMSESGVADRIVDWEDHPEKLGELYPIYNWSKIAFVFGFYGKLLKTKWKCKLSQKLKEQIINDQKIIFDHYGTTPN